MPHVDFMSGITKHYNLVHFHPETGEVFSRVLTHKAPNIVYTDYNGKYVSKQPFSIFNINRDIVGNPLAQHIGDIDHGNVEKAFGGVFVPVMSYTEHDNFIRQSLPKLIRIHYENHINTAGPVGVAAHTVDSYGKGAYKMIQTESLNFDVYMIKVSKVVDKLYQVSFNDKIEKMPIAESSERLNIFFFARWKTK